MEIYLPNGEAVSIGGHNGQKPSFVLNRWGTERNILLSLDSNENSLIKQIEGKLVWQGADNTLQLFTTPDGGIECEIVLLKHPPGNTIRLRMETSGLQFHYQPPLTEEFQIGVDGVEKLTSTHAYGAGNYLLAHRPEKIVGSYVAYHNKQMSMIKTKADGQKYFTGIAFQIFRPKCTDALGNTTWAMQTINDGYLEIKIDANWLTQATYPVVIDPEFGYHIIGGTNGGLGAALRVFASAASAPAGGNGVTDWLYVYSTNAGLSDVYSGLYTDIPGPGNPHGASPVVTLGVAAYGGAVWKQFGMAGLNVINGITYWLTCQFGYAGAPNIWWNVLGGTNRYWDDTCAPGAWNTPFTRSAFSGAMYSMYAEYTAGGGGGGEVGERASAIAAKMIAGKLI